LHLAATRRSGEPWTFSSSQTFKANGMPTTNKSNNKVQSPLWIFLLFSRDLEILKHVIFERGNANSPEIIDGFGSQL